MISIRAVVCSAIADDIERLSSIGVLHRLGPCLALPEADGAANGPASHACDRAFEEGLTFRPLEETVRDTLAWARGRELKAGLDRGREGELLAGPEPDSDR